MSSVKIRMSSAAIISLICLFVACVPSNTSAADDCSTLNVVVSLHTAPALKGDDLISVLQFLKRTFEQLPTSSKLTILHSGDAAALSEAVRQVGTDGILATARGQTVESSGSFRLIVDRIRQQFDILGRYSENYALIITNKLQPGLSDFDLNLLRNHPGVYTILTLVYGIESKPYNLSNIYYVPTVSDLPLLLAASRATMCRPAPTVTTTAASTTTVPTTTVPTTTVPTTTVPTTTVPTTTAYTTASTTTAPTTVRVGGCMPVYVLVVIDLATLSDGGAIERFLNAALDGTVSILKLSLLWIGSARTKLVFSTNAFGSNWVNTVIFTVRIQKQVDALGVAEVMSMVMRKHNEQSHNIVLILTDTPALVDGSITIPTPVASAPVAMVLVGINSSTSVRPQPRRLSSPGAVALTTAWCSRACFTVQNVPLLTYAVGHVLDFLCKQPRGCQPRIFYVFVDLDIRQDTARLASFVDNVINGISKSSVIFVVLIGSLSSNNVTFMDHERLIILDYPLDLYHPDDLRNLAIFVRRVGVDTLPFQAIWITDKLLEMGSLEPTIIEDQLDTKLFTIGVLPESISHPTAGTSRRRRRRRSTVSGSNLVKATPTDQARWTLSGLQQLTTVTDAFRNMLCVRDEATHRQTYAISRGCSGQAVDLAVVIDVSSSAVDNALPGMLPYVLRLVDLLGPDDRVALVTYAGTASVRFDLDDYAGRFGDAKQAISAVRFDGFETNTRAALRLLRTSVFVASRGDRPEATNIALVFTDGASNIDRHLTLLEASAVREHGVVLYVYGVGNAVRRTELEGMASRPVMQHLHLISSPRSADAAFVTTCVTEVKLVSANESWLQGAAGPDGLQGVVGEDGMAGISGRTGLVGKQGIMGSTGATGRSGDPGVATLLTSREGLRGQVGLRGEMGTAGQGGISGRTGSTGGRGTTGSTGSSGQPGLQGNQGSLGDVGVAGVTGQRGPPGLKGPMGLVVAGSRSCTRRCEHDCLAGECRCRDGYQLAEDGISCPDTDECSVLNGRCHHDCVNEPGSHHCSCRHGFALGRDGRSCIDVDECCKDGACLPPLSCINTFGSYACVDSSLLRHPAGGHWPNISAVMAGGEVVSVWDGLRTDAFIISAFVWLGVLTSVALAYLVSTLMHKDKLLQVLRATHAGDEVLAALLRRQSQHSFLLPRLSIPNLYMLNPTPLSSMLPASARSEEQLLPECNLPPVSPPPPAPPQIALRLPTPSPRQAGRGYQQPTGGACMAYPSN